MEGIYVIIFTLIMNGVSSQDCTRADLDLPQNSHVLFVKLDAYAILECLPGYQSLGGDSQGVIRCKGGSWQPSNNITCIQVDCGQPVPPHNGFCMYSSTSFRARVTCSCDINYTLSGDSSRICASDGKWSGEEPYCLSTDTSPTASFVTTIVPAIPSTVQSTLFSSNGHSTNAVSKSTAQGTAAVSKTSVIKTTLPIRTTTKKPTTKYKTRKKLQKTTFGISTTSHSDEPTVRSGSTPPGVSPTTSSDNKPAVPDVKHKPKNKHPAKDKDTTNQMDNSGGEETSGRDPGFILTRIALPIGIIVVVLFLIGIVMLIIITQRRKRSAKKRSSNSDNYHIVSEQSSGCSSNGVTTVYTEDHAALPSSAYLSHNSRAPSTSQEDAHSSFYVGITDDAYSDPEEEKFNIYNNNIYNNLEPHASMQDNNTYASNLSTIRPTDGSSFSRSEVATDHAYLNPHENYSHHINPSSVGSLYSIHEHRELGPYTSTPSGGYIEHARRINLAHEKTHMHHLLV